MHIHFFLLFLRILFSFFFCCSLISLLPRVTTGLRLGISCCLQLLIVLLFFSFYYPQMYFVELLGLGQVPISSSETLSFLHPQPYSQHCHGDYPQMYFLALLGLGQVPITPSETLSFFHPRPHSQQPGEKSDASIFQYCNTRVFNFINCCKLTQNCN